MKTAIYSRPDILHERGDLERFFAALAEGGFDFCANSAFAAKLEERWPGIFPGIATFSSPEDLPADIEMMISYGGDGTFLDSVRLLGTRPVPVLGINSGSMGFLANVSKSDEVSALKSIREGRYSVRERMLLGVSGDFPGEIDYPYAFNEFSIQKSGNATISVDVSIDGEPVASFLGDGVILSTPVGSTAYSLSVGGPVVAPECGCFVLSPIASHNLTVRPLVVPDTGKLHFHVRSRKGNVIATLDNREYTVPSGGEFSLVKAEKKVFLAVLENISFYRTLREKMMWGVDTRKFTK